LVSTYVTVVPAAVVTWAHDVFGNAVATATFQEMSTHIEIESIAELQLNAVAWPVFDIAASAIFYPFRYSDDEWTDLGALVVPQYPDLAGRLRGWSQRFVRSDPTDTLALLKDLNAGVAGAIRYQSREEEGTQSPIDTLDRGWGSCRDFAVLFAEAARCSEQPAMNVPIRFGRPDEAPADVDGATAGVTASLIVRSMDAARSADRGPTFSAGEVGAKNTGPRIAEPDGTLVVWKTGD
jgi:transglutaminase-like putative cysteine protease